MHLKRATFADGIVAEFLPPKKPSSHVVIICDGLPTKPSKAPLVRWFSKKGYWAFHMRYRGTWESEGRFLDHDPTDDVLAIIKSLPFGFSDVWSKESFSVQPKKVSVVGSSFGGCVALMASLSQMVDRVVALAPVSDWTAPTPGEPHDYLERVVRQGYGGCYRFEHEDWQRLGHGEFCQPVNHLGQFDPKKIFLIHAEDDKVVPVEQSREFVHHIGCQYRELKKGGHLSSSKMMHWSLSRSVHKFLSL